MMSVLVLTFHVFLRISPLVFSSCLPCRWPPSSGGADQSKRKARASTGFIIFSLVFAVVPSPCVASFWPSGAQWREAAFDALTDSYTWVPLTGAAVTGLTGLDHTISDWAVDNTPVFGSPENANTASDYLREATHVGMLASAVAVPEPWLSTAKRVLVEEAAAVATTSVTAVIKDAANRVRPDGSDNESFPSGHSSRVFAYYGMGSMNIDTLHLEAPVKTGLHIGLAGLATATAWARVEAGKHFPSDVLVGAALGNFIGRFLQAAFVGEQDNLQVNLYMGPDGGYLQVNLGLQ
jgi:membrane-associated phospholipid phosphatase